MSVSTVCLKNSNSNSEVTLFCPIYGYYIMDIHTSILWASLDIRLVSTTFKIKNLFNVKDAVPEGLRTRVAYKFSFASCNACYVGETSRHFSTRVREHLLWQVFELFRHLQSSESCPVHLVLSNILHTGLLPDPGLWSYFKNTKTVKLNESQPRSQGFSHCPGNEVE